VRPLLCLEIPKLDPALEGNQQLTSGTQCLEVVQRGRAALGLDVLGDEFIDGRLIRSLRENCRRAERPNDERNYETQMHRKLRWISDSEAPRIFKGSRNASASPSKNRFQSQSKMEFSCREFPKPIRIQSEIKFPLRELHQKSTTPIGASSDG